MPKKDDSRKFTAFLPKGLYAFGKSLSRFFLVYLIFIALFLLYLTFHLYALDIYQKTVREKEEKKLVYWEEVVKNHPNYPDGYYQAALSAIRLKQWQKAKDFLKKALLLDPNFKEAQELSRFVERNR